MIYLFFYNIKYFKYYDRAIKSLAVMRRQNAENNFENVSFTIIL